MTKNVRDIITKGRAFFQEIKNFTKFIEETYDRHYQTSLLLIANNAPHLKTINEYAKDGLKAIEKGDFNNGRWSLGQAQKMFKDELSSYDTVLAEDKKSLLALNGKAFILSDLGYVLTALAKIETYGKGIEKAKEARKCFETSMKIQESTNKAVNTETLKGMGLLLTTESMDGHTYFGTYESIPYFEKAVKIYPNDVVALKGLMYAYHYDDIKKAYNIGEKLLKLAPEDKGEILTEMAACLSLEGTRSKTLGAIDLYKEALNIDPENIRALRGLADTYYSKGWSPQLSYPLYQKAEKKLAKMLTEGKMIHINDFLEYEHVLVSLENLALSTSVNDYKATDTYVKKLEHLRKERDKRYLC